MVRYNILTDTNFEPIAEARVDAKHRVVLGKKITPQTSRYKIYRNASGQLILDPLVTIPAREAWLFANPQAAGAVRAGLDDAKHRRLTKSTADFTQHASSTG